ncbi:Hypothetical predicted protein [Pelobates cultripes]|uniref:Uncharacterized protein n=1 Tax=Pelobates cultripes TaxID=61616 RepID=A0AAD1QXY3_PELCU|nr:Hypothetical predicted protein [Pelobates cultripes]
MTQPKRGNGQLIHTCKWQTKRPKTAAAAQIHSQRIHRQVGTTTGATLYIPTRSSAHTETLLLHCWTKGNAARTIAATNGAGGAHPAPTRHQLTHTRLGLNVRHSAQYSLPFNTRDELSHLYACNSIALLFMLGTAGGISLGTKRL